MTGEWERARGVTCTWCRRETHRVRHFAGYPVCPGCFEALYPYSRRRNLVILSFEGTSYLCVELGERKVSMLARYHPLRVVEPYG